MDMGEVRATVRLWSLFVVAAWLSVASGASAEPPSDGFFRPLRPSALTGTWEGILPFEQELVRMEIGEAESFLGMTNFGTNTAQVSVYRLTSLSLERSMLKLKFSGRGIEASQILISGDAYTTELPGGDVIKATIAIKNPGTADARSVSMIFRRGDWLRQLGKFGRFAEEAIQRDRETAALQSGRIYNIPAYDQTIIQGDWPNRAPTAEEARRALRAAELFLHSLKASNKSEKETIDCIFNNKVTYRIQFIGTERSSKPAILCNFFFDQPRANGKLTFPNWHKQIVRHSHQGCDFWHIEYDLERDECSHFSTD